MNANTKKRLGKKRRSVVTETVSRTHAGNKMLTYEHKVVGPGARGYHVDSGKLRKASGKRKWLLDLRVKGT